MYLSSFFPFFWSAFFIMLTVNYKTFRHGDNDIMTCYTCCDYHRDESLILCSVYDLHPGLVIFYTDRSVVRRIAQSHLSVVFLEFFLILCFFSSNFVIRCQVACVHILLIPFFYFSFHHPFLLLCLCFSVSVSSIRLLPFCLRLCLSVAVFWRVV